MTDDFRDDALLVPLHFVSLSTSAPMAFSVEQKYHLCHLGFSISIRYSPKLKTLKSPRPKPHFGLFFESDDFDHDDDVIDAEEDVDQIFFY